MTMVCSISASVIRVLYLKVHEIVKKSRQSSKSRFKRNKQKYNFHNAAMSMITSQILKFVDFTKTQKFRYHENETYFLQIKNSLITHQGLLYGKKYFCSGGNLYKLSFHDKK